MLEEKHKSESLGYGQETYGEVRWNSGRLMEFFVSSMETNQQQNICLPLLKRKKQKETKIAEKSLQMSQCDHVSVGFIVILAL